MAGKNDKDRRDNVILLTVGSKYKICSVHGKEGVMVSEGIFRGYTSIGSDEAICIELSKKHKTMYGKLRVIPTSMILSIDIIEEVKREEESDKDTAVYFG